MHSLIIPRLGIYHKRLTAFDQVDVAQREYEQKMRTPQGRSPSSHLHPLGGTDDALNRERLETVTSDNILDMGGALK
jgi:hypothetical protein